jgi:hypothetical protein
MDAAWIGICGLRNLRIANPGRSCRTEYEEKDRSVQAAMRVSYTENDPATQA